MIVPKDFLIPIFNDMIRKGAKKFEVFEGWHDEMPLFEGRIEDGNVRVTSISRYDYKKMIRDEREVPNFFDLIQKVLHASGIMDPDPLETYKEKFEEIVKDEEPFRRNARFYYDTNSLMNNYFYLFREAIPGFTKKASHNISLGVVSELEDIFDRKLKGNYFQENIKSVYGRDDEMFYNQPGLSGRFARLAYSEVEYLKDTLRVNILTDDGVGDRRIMSAYAHDCQKFNLDGVIVTNDGTMSERAEMRMGSWHVSFDLSEFQDIKTKLEYFIDAVYRAAIVYGRVRVNDDMVVGGLWIKKRIEDWGSGNVLIEKCSDCRIDRIQRILDVVPADFHGKGYYS